MFPFLIGKVLTLPTNFKTEPTSSKEFPFLIGKVLTGAVWAKNTYFNSKFPFLIGKVLTTAFKPL